MVEVIGRYVSANYLLLADIVSANYLLSADTVSAVDTANHYGNQSLFIIRRYTIVDRRRYILYICKLHAYLFCKKVKKVSCAPS